MAKRNQARKLSRIGRNSTGIILPPKILADLGWHKRQRVLVKRVPRGILIIDAKTKKRKNSKLKNT
ncbi:MAG: hypothetical protein A3H72_03575 [Candidatus Doudnabacteria bacterium RIFCSPLOWO2_02_FULL_48_8]|uniref:SpoVT-AbrB domain-containing protein n=1 Tax=Candidatus Doudnabacteria bacterium RIFCSPHIGHO2_01_FULL_46_24 TaxID=1817825 RepID=A0A1F5NUC9_9BACT|nr:MAG: hypothetical protein A2720_01650 [Candidatus Doudnabacteria bacterium RIFCSPHIGHO2_01_FULL_46_24]OGE94952.1 MAG: hypothetical protein A3H72_03575 [Candidatus Doudnabacteria bacterium RIFCSPLOWO2_02_FULL_48_8]OGE95692.1 MAG: hypothetical protein A3E98_02110 [Candidatus Doudnabacteria bacterium RIFCSPHIGHO2_12_FULL_48_11]